VRRADLLSHEPKGIIDGEWGSGDERVRIGDPSGKATGVRQGQKSGAHHTKSRRHQGVRQRPEYRWPCRSLLGDGAEVGMTGDDPHFKTTYVHEELVERFLVSPAERALKVSTCTRIPPQCTIVGFKSIWE
jgi:hypothetical protein